MAETSQAANAAEQKPESGFRATRTYSYYVLGVLFLGYASNAIDRGILATLQEPIRHEFGLSDGSLGILGGVTFAIFYSTLGIPLAALADRVSRRNVLAACIAFWSISTALCGAATGFVTLALARIGTAIGEAGGSPPSHSLIADYFPREKRATALAVYALAIPFGAMLGSFGGGWANVYLGWRWTFVLVGLPGVLIALMVWLTVREPPRGHAETGIGTKAPPVSKVLRFLWSRASFRHLSIGAALHSLYFYAAANFSTSFFMRSHEMSTGIAGNWLALFSGVGAIGIFVGGFLGDHLARKHGDARWYFWMPAAAHVLIVPFIFLCFLPEDLSVVLPAFLIMSILNSVYFGPTAAMVQALVTSRMRGVAASFLIFIQTMIGLSIGPPLAGYLSDWLHPSLGEHALKYALVIIGLINIWSALHYYLGARKIRSDLDTTDEAAAKVV